MGHKTQNKQTNFKEMIFKFFFERVSFPSQKMAEN
jgi:hypothetical protein